MNDVVRGEACHFIYAGVIGWVVAFDRGIRRIMIADGTTRAFSRLGLRRQAEVSCMVPITPTVEPGVRRRWRR